jgi:Prokaryotic N-terminal methylation motif
MRRDQEMMNLRRNHQSGFTLGEAMVAMAVATLLLAGLFTAATALNRANAASDDYFSTHMQQIRIIDYLSRDVKRSYSVTTSPDLQTVTCIMPDFVIQAGDPEAVTDATTIGQRRKPVVVGPPYRAVVDYGSRTTRSVADGATTNASTTLTSATAAFGSIDVGNPITGTNIQSGTTITAVNSATSVTMSKPATATGTNIWVSIYGDGNRTVMDASTTNASTTITSSTAYFQAADVGKPILGASIAAGTTIASVTNTTTAVLSQAANADAGNLTVTIGGTVVVYTVSGSTITRTENGVVTTVASSTDQLLPLTTDWQLSNTEYTTSTVTFQPFFIQNANQTQQQMLADPRRAGTTVYTIAYLRNKRRGN